MRKDETVEKRLEQFKYACYTEICTMNSPENSEYEKGYMAGIRMAQKLAEQYLSENKRSC